MDLDSPNMNGPAGKTGIVFWMEQVLRGCSRAGQDFAPDPVHDLRVGLRRCRSIAAGFMHFDPDPAWADMRREGARLFRKLGELRDNQVAADWARDAAAPRDEASAALLRYLLYRAADLKRAGAEALNKFDRKKWAAWSKRLSSRAARLPIGGLAFKHLALESLEEARYLHQQALRNRSHISFHRLRIGLKKFRYIIENFLPGLLDEWGPDLRGLQDLLGEVHDLHVLMQTAVSIHAFPDDDARCRWRRWIDGEIGRRLALYRLKMTGDKSLWRVWRSGLPAGELLESAAMERLQTWASFRDPDCRRTRSVAQLALRIYDDLSRIGSTETAAGERTRAILRAAALLHAVGGARRTRKEFKESYRLIRSLKPPIGWTSDEFRMVALAVRYHRGVLPAPGHKDILDLPAPQRRLVAMLSGILRLAASLAGL